MNLALTLFLSCDGRIPKTPAQKRKEKQALLKAETVAFNRAAKQEIRCELRDWLRLPQSPLSLVLLSLFHPMELNGKLVWKELYLNKHYPEKYYD